MDKNADINYLLKVENALKEQKRWMESIWFQKARELWFKERDRNTKYFHTSLLIRRRSNMICGILDAGTWAHSRKEIRRYFVKEFEEHFKSSNPAIPDDVWDLGKAEVSERDNQGIMTIPTAEEIKETIWSLHHLKAPIRYGFPGSFYGNCWKTVQEQIIRFV